MKERDGTMNQVVEVYYHLQNGITIFPSHDRAIDQVLADLVSQVPAHFVLLTDTTGQLISAQGNRGKIDLVALGVLVAGELAASQEIARLTGEHQDYQMIMREGQKSHTFISEAGRHLALLTKVSHDVPLGWVRMLVRKAAHQLADIIAMPPQEAESSNSVLSQDDKRGLPDLIGDALKDLWLE
jgi:predicted regulator of Ras-like GTPase activity (Roadblock/LC7/MglB family)